MLTDPVDDVMVEAINRIGHVMKIATIAEGVESEALLKRLGEIGIDYAQSYCLGRPERFRPACTSLERVRTDELSERRQLRAGIAVADGR